jgi:hypothetical protein
LPVTSRSLPRGSLGWYWYATTDLLARLDTIVTTQG